MGVTDQENFNKCRNSTELSDGEAFTSAVMFSLGVVGNVAALVLLTVLRAKNSPSVYHVLVTTLLLTDLLGTLTLSPLVLSAYGRRKSLRGLSAGGEVCSYFAFGMTYFSLCTLTMLCMLALERYFSIVHPYFYERHLSKRRSHVSILVVYLSSALFCVAPLLGFGRYVQYCPGTWCFPEMNCKSTAEKVYIGFYATFVLIMTTITEICNIIVIVQLVKMYRRHKVHRGSASGQRASLSMTEEIEHLLPLAIITVVFICCTLPFVMRVYINFFGKESYDHNADLNALRFLSFHSIINPWVFIILRPSILKVMWRKLRNSTFIPKKTLGAPLKPTEETSCSAGLNARTRGSTEDK